MRSSANVSRRLCLHIVSAVAAAATSLVLPTLAHAADYPTKPIKLIVPFAAGGSTDIIARVLAEGLRQTLGQPVVVDNRAGAGGLLGTEAITQAAGDGYTIGMGTVSTLTINPLLYTRAQALVPQLTPVANLVTMPSVFMVHPSMGVHNFRDFVAKVQAHPGQYSGGVPGLGTLGHLMLASFNESLKTQIQIVPYRGNGPALNDALAGVTQVMTDQLPSAMAQIKAGKLLPVVVSADRRIAELPDVPTFNEVGQPGLNQLGISWFGLVVPHTTPAPIVAQLQKAALEAAQLPSVQKQLTALGAYPTQMEQSTFPAQIAAQTQHHKALLDQAGIKAE